MNPIQPSFFRSKSNSSTLLYVGIAGAMLFVFAVVLVVFLQAQKARQIILNSQQNSFNAPQPINKRQVNKITLTKENGYYIEIMGDGRINEYDAEGNLIKAGLLGYYQVNRLFNRLNDKLDGFDTSMFGKGNYLLTVYSNKGTTTIRIAGGGGGNGDIDDIIDDIIDLEEGTLYPTVTPTLQPTQPGNNYTATPTPIISYVPNPTIVPTPTVGPGTPTPLPPYMTNDPFECDDYATQLKKPMPISNTFCGLNPDAIK